MRLPVDIPILAVEQKKKVGIWFNWAEQLRVSGKTGIWRGVSSQKSLEPGFFVQNTPEIAKLAALRHLVLGSNLHAVIRTATKPSCLWRLGERINPHLYYRWRATVADVESGSLELEPHC